MAVRREAKLVKDADQLDIDLELKELEEKGHKIPEKWSDARDKMTEETLHTKSAKRLYRKIKKSDPSSWYNQI